MADYQPPHISEDRKQDLDLIDIDFSDMEAQPKQQLSFDQKPENDIKIELGLEDQIVKRDRKDAYYDILAIRSPTEAPNLISTTAAETGLLEHPKVTGCFKFLKVDYYRKHFEITTDQVLDRVKHAMAPLKQESVFGTEQKYDLYGPIWIVLTLNILISICGNLAGYLDYVTTDEDQLVYKAEVAKVTSSASFLTAYFLLVPAGLYFAFKILGEAEHMPKYFYLVSVYGYSFAPYLPAVILYVLPFNTMKWAVLLFAGGISLYFIAKEMFGLAA